MFNYYLKDLPSFGKLFVGLFTFLMLCVCLWAVFIFYVENGMYTEEEAIPLYEQVDNNKHERLPTKEEVAEDVAMLSEDSLARLAPIWDSVLAGEDALVDSTTMAKFFPKRDSMMAGLKEDQNLMSKNNDHDDEEGESLLRHNLGLAHTHVNGQTLLYFALGLVFLFTSVKPKIKIISLSVFGVAVLTHTVGLSGQHMHWFFDDILAVSGVTLLVVIPYICFLIFADLWKK